MVFKNFVTLSDYQVYQINSWQLKEVIKERVFTKYQTSVRIYIYFWRVEEGKINGEEGIYERYYGVGLLNSYGPCTASSQALPVNAP